MIGIIGAMSEEIDELVNNSSIMGEEEIAGCKIYTGKIGDNDVAITLSGIGKVNASIAATLLINNYECDAIINTGIAGGISPLHSRDVVIASKIYYHDVDVTKFGYKIGQIPGMPPQFMADSNMLISVKRTLKSMNISYKEGIILSGDCFITDINQLNTQLEDQFIACEMEGAAIAQTCLKFNIPFVSIRFISDIIGTNEQVENYKKFENEMAILSSSICHKVVEKL